MKKIISLLTIMLVVSLLVGCGDSKGEETLEDGNYIFTFRDSSGNPVEGVRLIMCDDEQCMTYVSDGDGEIDVFTAPAQYSVHILTVPDGFVNDYQEDILTGALSDRIDFVLRKQ